MNIQTCTLGICSHIPLIPTGFNLELQPKARQAPHTDMHTQHQWSEASPVCASTVIGPPNTLLDNAGETVEAAANVVSDLTIASCY